MKTTLALVILLISLNGFSGDGFPPLIQISPNNIDTSTQVEVGIRLSPCSIVGEDFFSTIEGNSIQLAFARSRFSPCTPGFFVQSYSLGTLPEGQYTITVYVSPGLELPPNPLDAIITSNQYGEPVTFLVGQVRAVPFLNLFGLLSMAVSMMLIAFISFKRGWLVYAK